MRVLHLDAGREMRGGQWQVMMLLQGLGEGHTLLTPADGPLMREARARGIPTASLSLMRLAGMARNFDLVHAHDARSHTWAAVLSPNSLVVSRRVAFPVKTSVASRWKYSHARHYIAVSDFVRRTLTTAGVPEEKISVVYDGVQLPESVLPADAGVRIVAPASDDPMKGSDLLRRAIDLIGHRVMFSEDLVRDLPGASLLAYITRSEGLGSAALMAMAYGVPVVASRVGGLPEIVKDGVNGFLTTNDPESIGDAILRALADRNALAREARRGVEERFSVAHMVEETRNVYRQVLGA